MWWKGSLKLIALVACCLIAYSAQALSQGSSKIWRVGILWHAANLPEEQVMFGPFSEGMRDLGYIEGRNVVYEHTFVDEDFSLFQVRAQELIDRKVDVILASVPAAAAAAGKLTKSVPIVFATSGDPVQLGLVQSLARPGGNLTGLSLFYPELTTKHLELLLSIVPSVSRVAVLTNPSNADASVTLAEAKKAATALKLELVPVGAASPDEFPTAFASITNAKVTGMIVLGDSMLRINRKPIVAFAASSKLPTVYSPRDYVEEGGLIAYGVSIPENFRRSAAYVDKILKGTKPGDLPVEQPTKLSLVINLKTAKELGLAIAPTLLSRADEVIE
jgi:putative tryptophan/tyrosine transport system substrate-binding protein